MQSETVVRTAVCPLETSERKNDKLRRGTEQFSEAARTAAAILPSFPEHTWRRNNTQIYRATKRELGEYDIKDKVVQNAVKRVVANFRSTRELGSGVPNNGIDDCNFVLLTNQGYEIASNDRGYGFRGNFIPFKPEWWHMDIGQHQRQYLERGLDGDGRLGQVELAYNDGNPLARVAVSWEQAVTEYADAEYVVGVDIGYRGTCVPSQSARKRLATLWTLKCIPAVSFERNARVGTVHTPTRDCMKWRKTWLRWRRSGRHA